MENVNEHIKYLKYYKARQQTDQYRKQKRITNLKYRLKQGQMWVNKDDFVDIVSLYLNNKYEEHNN